jgi:hypothetical protein
VSPPRARSEQHGLVPRITLKIVSSPAVRELATVFAAIGACRRPP